MARTEAWTEPERTTPILLEADVVVVGGSPTGVAAAVGAARTGASVALIERDGVLGGQGADIFTVAPWQFIDADLEWVVGGITREIILRATELGDCDYLWETVPGQIPPAEGEVKPFELTGNATSGQHEEEGLLSWRDATVEAQSLRFALHQMCEEAGVTLLLDSTMSGVMMEANRVVGVLFEFRGQRFGVATKVVVDATGHGDVAARAGCAFQNYYDLEAGYVRSINGELRPRRGGYAGTHTRVCNVNFDETLAYMRERPDQWHVMSQQATIDDVERMVRLGNSVTLMGFWELRWRAVQDDPVYKIVGRGGDLDTPEPGLPFVYQGDGLVMAWNRSLSPLNLLDPVAFSKVEAEIRKHHWILHRLYRSYVPGFGASRLLGVPTHVGTAFSRRVAVEHAVTTDEVLQGAHFDDVVGRAVGHDWDIVGHHHGFEIPYRSLLPRDVDGLLVTGKSAGPFLHLVATCACTGHAAGVAAGLAAAAGQTPRQLDVDLLQKTLLAQDAVL